MADGQQELHEDLKGLEPMRETKLSTPMGIAAIALNMAMKYHDFATVQDGALYQQYKLEGRNMTPLHLDMVFETAMQIEMHLLTSERRIATMIADTLVDIVKAEIGEEAKQSSGDNPDSAGS